MPTVRDIDLGYMDTEANFKAKYEKPIKMGQRFDASVAQVAEKAAKADALARKLHKIFLRR